MARCAPPWMERIRQDFSTPDPLSPEGSGDQKYHAAPTALSSIDNDKPCSIVARREANSPISPGRLLTRVCTHSMIRADNCRGMRLSMAFGAGMASSTRKLFSPFFSVNSVGILRPVRHQYMVAPRL